MFSGNGWNIQPGHGAHLGCPEAAGIDHPFAGNIAILGVDNPFTVGLLRQSGDLGVLIDFGAEFFGSQAHSLGNAVGIDISVVRPVKSAQEAFDVHHRVQFRDFIRRHPRYVQSQTSIHAVHVAQLIHSIRVIGCPYRPGGMPAGVLAGFRFELLVDFDAFHIDPGTVVIAVEK